MAFQISDLQTALRCISSNASQDEKNQALAHLEAFQKSQEAWTLASEILDRLDSQQLELSVFAAQTLRNKVTYDLAQLGPNTSRFKDTLLNFLRRHNENVVVTQLNVALARLCIQDLSWNSPILEIINCLISYPSKLLNFLQILPEESMQSSSTPLTDAEFNSRTYELITSISEDVLSFLMSCAESLDAQHGSAQGFTLEQILKCLGSWSYEFPVDKLLSVEPLMALVFNSISNNSSLGDGVLDPAIDCLCTILRETRDVSNETLVLPLFQQLMLLQAKLLPTLMTVDYHDIHELDPELMEAFTRLFVEAGEAWIVFIAKSPQVYQPLVIVILMLTCKNPDLDVAAYTFPFWFNLKQNIVLPRYQKSREMYVETFVGLINGIILHLQYPQDSFESKESEDVFKEFRYHMGDVLKDCTAVVGTSLALTQPFQKLKDAIGKNSSWQTIEAPLFSLRTMAQEISLTENIIIPQIFDIVCKLPEHPKIRYAATLVFGRYTEWTAKHPEMLEMQLRYIFSGFQNTTLASKDIITASSHSLMYFCLDCSELLSDYLGQLMEFYLDVESSIDMVSKFELCQGLSAVINKQSTSKVSGMLQTLLDSNISKMNALIPEWQVAPHLYSEKIADRIDLLYALFEELRPRYQSSAEGSEPLIAQIQFIWTNLERLISEFGAGSDAIIIERMMKFLRRLIEKFHIFCEGILASVAETLVREYATTRLGSYLWCSGSLVVVFGDDEALPIPVNIKSAVWQFALSQCNSFAAYFASLNSNNLNEHHEVIMDFFGLVSDMIMFYPKEFILSPNLLSNTTEIALIAVSKLDKFEACIQILRCLDDIISWGFKTPPISTVALDYVPDEWRKAVCTEVIVAWGSIIVSTLLTESVTNFNANCHTEAISSIVKCLALATELDGGKPNCIQWLNDTVDQLGGATEREKMNLLEDVNNGLVKRDFKRAREGIRRFINWYVRKNVAPRS